MTRLALLLAILAVPIPAEALEQWFVQVPGRRPDLERKLIGYIDLETETSYVFVTFPDETCLGGSALSADGSIFYVMVESELWRFDTATHTQLEPLPNPAGPCSPSVPRSMNISGDDHWWWFSSSPAPGVRRFQIVDATTQQIVYDALDGGFIMAFTPDRLGRLELIDGGLALRPNPQSNDIAWLAPLTADNGFLVHHVTMSDTVVYVLYSLTAAPFGGYWIQAYDLQSGAERQKVRLADVLPSSVHPSDRIEAARGAVYLGASRASTTTIGVDYLLVLFDPVALTVRSITSLLPETALNTNTLNGVTHFSPDASLLYLQTQHSGTSGTSYITYVVDAESLRVVATRFGPIAGSLTRYDVAAAPSVRGLAFEGNRIRVQWQPAAGPPPQSFLLRGAIRGQPTSVIAVIPGNQRTWESPPLPPGSYTLEVSAVNFGGIGARSAALEFSIGEAQGSSAPMNLLADVVDDLAILTWQPNPSGPAPAGYIVEAVPAGGSTFFEVTRVTLPEIRAPRVPAGAWWVRVRAFTAGGVSAPSDIVSVVAAPCSAPPGAATSLSAIVTGQLVTLRWTPPAAGSAEDYVIEAGTASGVFNLGSLPSGQSYPSFEVTAPRGTYFVRVRGRNACGDGPQSNEAIVVISAFADVPDH